MSDPKQAEGPGATIEVSSRRFEVPFECPCCGATPDADLAVPMSRAREHRPAADTARELVFPYCRACARHVEVWEATGLISAAVVLTGGVATLALVIAGQLLVGVISLVAALAVATVVVQRRRRQASAATMAACASPGVSVTYFGWSGNTSALAFRSPTYAARFAEHNPQTLTNVGPGLRRLLDGHRVARLAVPTPAAVTTVPPPPDARGWRATLEAASTRSARRHALRAALEMVPDRDAHLELVDLVARAELAPVVRRLERLSGSARRAAVDVELARVRADNVPDELQQAELAILEALRTR